jgi:hypothetical protein
LLAALIQNNSCDKKYGFFKSYSRGIMQDYNCVLDNNREFLEEVIKIQAARDSGFVRKYKKLSLEYIEVIV